MQIKTRSTLPTGAFFMQVVVLLDLVVLVCVLTIMTSRVGIALRLDSAVSRALEQQLVDMVLAKGMTCYIAAEPAD